MTRPTDICLQASNLYCTTATDDPATSLPRVTWPDARDCLTWPISSPVTNYSSLGRTVYA
eukprot:6185721-Pleurochrysis_carterae.AAC.1